MRGTLPWSLRIVVPASVRGKRRFAAVAQAIEQAGGAASRRCGYGITSVIV
jgi:hypothetical protein